jgi:hypothetical protein
MNPCVVVTAAGTAVVCIASFIPLNPEWPYPDYVISWLFAEALGFLNRSRFPRRCRFYISPLMQALLAASLAWAPD